MDKKSELPIGVFDSGLGGLTVVKQLIKILPNENIIYLGDNARVPYGGRSKETIIKFSMENANFLLTKNVKCIVIACNTSSALAGSELKEKLNIPVFDVISPVIETARQVSKSGRIGVIGTRGTIGSHAYPFDFQKSCPLFVPFIEEGEIDNEALNLVAKEYLKDFKNDKIDTLILGCTHYPIIKDIISKNLNKNVSIIDPGESLAETVYKNLSDLNLLNKKTTRGEQNYFVTDLTERFTKTAEMFLGHNLDGNITKIELTPTT